MLDLTARDGAPKDDLGFFLMWLRRPRRLGAVLPSGRALARAMAHCIDRDAPGVVVELGGGTGSITKEILKAGIPPRDLIVVEREAALSRILARRYPGVRVLCADARQLHRLLDRAGVARVKAVVSGLPLLSLERRDCHRLLYTAFSVLAEDGEFLQFTYGPASPVTPRQRDALGIVGKREEWILSNLPPAAVWRYQRVDIADRARHRAA